jgi:DnaJ-class molecular chaperone
MKSFSQFIFEEPKKKYASRCPRCEGTGRHQGGRCYQCHGKMVIGLKSSKYQTLHTHSFKIDGKKHLLKTWGKDTADSWDVAKKHLSNMGYHQK